MFGTIYDTISLGTTPVVTAARAALILASAGNGVVGPASGQALVVLPLDGGARLMRTARVFSKVDGHVERIFVHAQFYRAFTQMLTTGSTICVTRGSAMEQRLRTCGFSRGGSGSQHPPTAASRC